MTSFLSVGKVNLFLRILNRRADGYHELVSFFQAISLADTLTFTPSTSDKLFCTHPDLPLDARNLIVKAVELFRHEVGCPSFEIKLEKRIPLGAGLGGGSSNAATTLFALNALTGGRVSEVELMRWGAKLGSDVAFFFSQGSALGRGRGELIEKQVSPELKKPLWLIVPPYSMSTPLVYSHLQLSACSKVPPEQLVEALKNGPHNFTNDLEKPVFSLEPRLRKLKNDLLAQGFAHVFLTGSGSGMLAFGEGVPQVDSDHICHALKWAFRASSSSWYEIR